MLFVSLSFYKFGIKKLWETRACDDVFSISFLKPYPTLSNAYHAIRYQLLWKSFSFDFDWLHFYYILELSEEKWFFFMLFVFQFCLIGRSFLCLKKERHIFSFHFVVLLFDLLPNAICCAKGRAERLNAAKDSYLYKWSFSLAKGKKGKKIKKDKRNEGKNEWTVFNINVQVYKVHTTHLEQERKEEKRIWGERMTVFCEKVGNPF